MKKFLSRNLMAIVAVVLVLSQGLLFSFVYMSKQAQAYTTEVEQTAFEKGQKFTIANIPQQKKQMVKSKLFSLAHKNNLAILRISSLSNNRGIQVSIYGEIQRNADNFDYEFFGKKIFNTKELQKLLESKNGDATLGLDQGSINMLNDLSHFKYGGKVVINKLATVLEDDEKVEGRYIVLGLKNDRKKNIFFDELAKETGIDKKILSGWKEEYTTNWGNEVAFPALVAIFEILLLILVSLLTIKELNKMGNLLLQGWSRKDFALKIYSPVLTAGFISIFLFVGYGIIFTEGSFISPMFFSTMLFVGLLNFILICIIVLIASAFIFMISPIDAIRNRISKKGIMIAMIVLFLLGNAGLVGAGAAIDGPMKEVSKNEKIRQAWEAVRDIHILSDTEQGGDELSLQGNSNKLAEDMYKWYKSIEGKDGVYIAGSDIYDNKTLRKNRQSGEIKYVPNNPYCEFVLSPNYLKDTGNNVDPSLLKKANEGTRVYLVSSSINKQDRELIKKSIREEDVDKENPKKIEFVEHTFEKKLFTWNADSDYESYTDKAVVLLSTPNNMIFTEKGSLFASGLKNSYLKFTKEAKQKYVNDSVLKKYHLSDNKLTFKSVSEHVDGIQKRLSETIQLFTFGIILLMVSILIFLAIIISLYKVTFEEEIIIKRFMGYNRARIYSPIVILCILVLVLDFVASQVIRCRISSLLVLIMGILEIILFYIAIEKGAYKRIVSFLKS